MKKYSIESTENNKNISLNSSSGGRNSNLELLRILAMLVIVAHHYVVNSGLLEIVNESSRLTGNDMFLLLFGWGGKTGINCFVLITGYFMCKSQMKWKKFWNLFAEFLFYKTVIYVLFVFAGYQSLSMGSVLRTVFPFFQVATNFTGCFLLFYLFLPFLNKWIQSMEKSEHEKLMALLLFIYTVLPSFFKAEVSFNYITWFIVLYILAAYIRMYPRPCFSSVKLWGILSIVMLALSWASVLGLAFLERKTAHSGIAYFFVADSNKVLALTTAVCIFLFFKNITIRQSRIINTISASTFGVLLIHANSDAMRKWLWQDTLHNTQMYGSSWLPVHAVLSVLAVFFICTMIDHIRIRSLSFIKHCGSLGVFSKNIKSI